MGFNSAFKGLSMCKRIQLKSETPTRWNLIGRSVTAPPPVSSPSSILPHLRHVVLSFPQSKIRRPFQKSQYFNFSYFYPQNFISLKLHKLREGLYLRHPRKQIFTAFYHLYHNQIMYFLQAACSRV